MRSITISSDEMLDGHEAAMDMVQQILAFPLGKHSCGIILVEAEYDYEEALKYLHEHLPDIPFVGTTSLAQVSNRGYSKLGMTMLLLTADDCTFSVAGSDGLGEQGLDKIRQIYQQALEGLGGEVPAGAFVFSKLTPQLPELDKLKLLDSLIGHRPIIGGIASDNFLHTFERNFMNNNVYNEGYVLLLVAGNFKPLVRVGNVPHSGLARYKVTESEGTILKSIDNTPVIDFLKGHGVNTESPVGLLFAPFSDIEGDSKSDNCAVSRPLISLNKEKGTALSYVNMPQNSMVSFQIIQGTDLKATATGAAKAMLADLKEKEGGEYAYSTVFCVTCAGRHAVLAFDREFEGQLAKDFFADKYSVAGFYAFTEIGPTFLSSDGTAHNNTHNLSVIFCAF